MNSRGQILLITLLVMVVGLTVGLSVIARSVTSVKISTQEEESQRAFYAAEAGIEQALILDPLPAGRQEIVSGTYYTLRVGAADPDKFVLPETTSQDGTRTIWLVSHNDDGTICAPSGCNPPLPPPSDGRYIRPGSTIQNTQIDICWSEVTANVPAMEVILLHQRTIGNLTYGVARGAYDPDAGRRTSNSFEDISSSSGNECNEGFQYRRRIRFGLFGISGNRRVVAMRLRPIYADAKMAVQSVDAAQLPPQGRDIESTGQAGTAQRKVKIFRPYPLFPPIFDFAVFSGTDLTK